MRDLRTVRPWALVLPVALAAGCVDGWREAPRVGEDEQAVKANGNPNPSVAPPGSRPYGRSYAEWGRAWWEWALSFRAASNPILDPGPVVQFGDADDQPSGPVWFLAGTFFSTPPVTPTERWLEVPTGKALLVPLVNTIPWPPEDCWGFGLSTPPDGCSAEDLVDAAAASVEPLVPVLHASLDGAPITDLGRYRAQLSEPFTYNVTADGLLADFAYPVGPRFPTVSDGYYLMLHPLARGAHTVEISAGEPAFLHVRYHLTVR